jgi:hypothetical protein
VKIIYWQFCHFTNFVTFAIPTKQGGLAQLARALAWHARGHRFDSDILHLIAFEEIRGFFFVNNVYVEDIIASDI